MTDEKRYNLKMRSNDYEQLKAIADRDNSTVLAVITKFIRDGLMNDSDNQRRMELDRQRGYMTSSNYRD